MAVFINVRHYGRFSVWKGRKNRMNHNKYEDSGSRNNDGFRRRPVRLFYYNLNKILIVSINHKEKQSLLLYNINMEGC